MKTNKLLLISLSIILISGCSINKNNYLSLDTTDELVQYTKTEIYNILYPYIAAQVMDTAASLYYYNSNNNKYANEISDPMKKELPGICLDYAIHFYQNYTGPGELSIVCVLKDGESILIKVKKKFVKTDLYSEHIDAYINSCYIFLNNIADKSDTIFTFNNDNFYSFYLERINNEIYWFQGNYDYNNDIDYDTDTLITFKKDHLKQSLNIDNLFSNIMEEYYKEERTLVLEFFNMKFITAKNELLIIETYPIETPASHVGLENEEFYNHAWIRLVHYGVTIDVDPTYIEDDSWILDEIIEVID